MIISMILKNSEGCAKLHRIMQAVHYLINDMQSEWNKLLSEQTYIC